MIRYQRTIKKDIICNGIGLHTGKTVQMTLKSAATGTGVVFIRTDLANTRIRASAANTDTTSYATSLSRNSVSVKTVEHLLAAFAGLNIDNVYVELDGEEIPIMDGSARPFVKLIADAGILTQESFQPALKIIAPIFVRDGSKQLTIWPSEKMSISFFIDFPHPLLKEQSVHYRPTEEAFLREVSEARTFGFMSDVRVLQANGLAKGASLDNAVALDEKSVLNDGGLRFRDEFVRHKVLDLIGDLSLAGMPIIGHIVAHKSGHSMNAQMVGKLLNSPQTWILVGSPEDTGVSRQEPLVQQAAF
jgi:UDP-3-O-[3-hydroxymyristoyl] N-acetylglucosamine deacetylase